MKTRIYSRQVAKTPSSESFFLTFAPLRPFDFAQDMLCARYSDFRLRLCRARLTDLHLLPPIFNLTQEVVIG